MSLASRAINRLRELYRSVFMHMRELNARLFSPARPVLSVYRPCSVEQLEPRLLLSGHGVDFPGEVPPQYAVGSRPNSVVAGDFDGDGTVDLVTANSGSYTVSVLLNTGHGTLAAQVTYPVGIAPYAVTAANFDGDGAADLATANYSSNTVSVLRNMGDGTFAAQATYWVGSNPNSVVAGDFDGDGSVDLVTANSGSDTVSVLLNMGDGTFAAQATYAVGLPPRSVTAADFDGDGWVDLVTANNSYSGGTVSVLRNLGDGTFAAQATYVVGLQPEFVTAADFDGDGAVDLVTANYHSDTVSVLLNLGDGTFAAQATFGVGSGPKSVVAADFDGDGAADLVTANSSSNTVSVLLNLGDGTFATQATFRVGSGPAFVTAADLDGDGAVDLATANSSSNTVSVLLNLGDGTFPAQATYAVGSTPKSVAAADLDGDGSVDLVTANMSANTVSVLLNLGDGTFATQATYPVEIRPECVAAADFDGDGTVDLVTANFSSNTASVLLNLGDGTFAAQATYAVGIQPAFVTAADFDGDGAVDLVTANCASDTVSVLLNLGDGTFATQATYVVGSGPNSMVAADLDGNGTVDLVAANYHSNNYHSDNYHSSTVSVLLNLGDGTFATQATYVVGLYPSYMAAADFDGDGSVDLVTATASSNTVSVLLNLGNGTFATQTTYVVGNNPWFVTTADLDGDGAVDLATANYSSSTVSVLLNLGDGTFATKDTYSVASRPYAVAAADLDGDGAADLVTVNSFANMILVLLNNVDDSFFRPHVTGASIIGYDPYQVIRLSFSEPMATGTFDAAADVLSLVGPGPAHVLGYVWQDDRTLDLYCLLEAYGDYTLTLGPDIRSADGEWMDGDRDGTCGEPAEDISMLAVAMTPPHIATYKVNQGMPAHAVTIKFDRPMRPESFDATEDVVSFYGPAGQLSVNGWQWLDERTLDVVVDASVAGNYALVVGPEIMDRSGASLDHDGDLIPGEAGDDEYTITFRIDSPAVTGFEAPALPPMDWVTIHFNRDMDATTFSIADDLLDFVGPAGDVTVTGFSWVDSQTLRLETVDAGAGPCAFQISGAILDAWGNALDGDGDGVVGEAEDGYTASFITLTHGTINEELTIGGPNVLIQVDGDIRVLSGATLTVLAGTVMKFMGPSAGITVDGGGKLVTVGTTQSPVTFTSYLDDLTGGDTNSDGDATTPSCIDWRGIRIESNGRAELAHTEIAYASKAIDANSDYAKVTLSAVTLRRNDLGIYVYRPYTTVTAENCLIIDNNREGVYVRASSSHTFRNCTIVGNGFGDTGHERGGIHVGAATLTLDNCIVAFNANGLNHTSADDSQTIIRSSVFYNPDGQDIVWTAGGEMPQLDQGGNLVANPLFVDRAAGDYGLAAGSPAIDAGLGFQTLASDLLGQPRYDDPGIPNRGAGYPSYVDIGAFERQTATISGDLAVSSVSSPTPLFLSAGETFSVDWTVTNVGFANIAADWQDKLYLSRDQHVDSGDTVLATLDRTGGLTAGASYSDSYNGVAPAESGPWYLLVRTNASGSFVEPNLADNLVASPIPLGVDVPIVEVGGAASGSVSAGQWKYLRLDATVGNTIVLSLANDSGLKLYASKDVPPTLNNHDFTADAAGELRILDPADATYYIGVYALAGSRIFTVSVASTELAIREVTPGVIGNAGQATLRILGDNFSTDAQVQLIATDGGVIEAEEHWQDSGTLFATFDLAAVDAAGGLYDLAVANSSHAFARASETVQVRDGGEAELSVNLVVPGASRPGRSVQVTITYQNLGSLDMPSPILSLESLPGVGWAFLGDGVIHDVYDESIDVLGTSGDGPTGILRPGQTESMSLTARAPLTSSSLPVTLTGYGASSPMSVDAGVDVGSIIGPVDVATPSVSAQEVFRDTLVEALGNSWGEVARNIGSLATGLASVGMGVYDVRTVMSGFTMAAAMAATEPGATQTPPAETQIESSRVYTLDVENPTATVISLEDRGKPVVYVFHGIDTEPDAPRIDEL